MRAKATENLILGMERQASGRAMGRGRIQPRRAALASSASAPSGTRGLIFCPTCDANGNRLEGEYAAADEKSVFVYAGATAPAYMIRGDVTYRIVTDNQGSVRLVVNTETGEIAQRLDYDSFGRVLCDTNPGFQPFGFQGGLYDPDTGLVEFGCRWYDAQTGRWISKDPILLDGGWNVYAFCDNDPINRTDPSGLCELFVYPSIIGPVFPLAPVRPSLSTREQALQNARKNIGSHSWDEDRGVGAWVNMPKCNKFVADMYNQGHLINPIPTGLCGTKPPRAADWYSGRVPAGFTRTQTPRPGDIATDGLHMGVFSGSNTTISATISRGVVENDWGFRSSGPGNSDSTIFYTYQGD